MKSSISAVVFSLSAALSLTVLTSTVDAQVQTAPAKRLTAIGSDSMGSMMRRWVESFEEKNPSIDMQVVSRGSATAPAALIDGNADLGPMARPMKVSELDQFRSRYGFEPTQVRTSLAAVAVSVPAENPLEEISFDDLDRIFSNERKRSHAARITLWKDLGVKGALANQQVLPLGLEPENQATSYFRQQVLLQGNLVDDLLATTDSRSLLEALRTHRNGIAFGEISTAPHVKVLAVRKDSKTQAALPSESNIVSGAYPLGRYLNIYIVRYPGEELEANLKSFLQFVLSPAGQALVKSEGLIALPAEVLKEELAKLE